MALIRYPGSKRKLAVQIISAFPDSMQFKLWAHAAKWQYIEPFFGAGAIGFDVLRILPRKSRVVLNDKDYGLVSLWNAVLSSPRELIELIRAFTPEAEAFYEFKQRDGDTSVDPVEAGFRKLALHQMSVSGFGFMSGGPLGGKDQENAKYRVDCRWNPERLVSHVLTCHRTLARFENVTISGRDFSEVLRSAGERTFVYLDPPYVEKGGMLYKHNMTEDDHRRLCGILKSARFHWALSYDDNEFIRDIYSWAEIHEVSITYTNATLRGQEKRPKNREVVIRPKAAV